MKHRIVIAAGIATVALTAGCSGRSSGAVAPSLPPTSSTPVAVVRAYLAAAKADHCAFTQALTLPRTTWNWCHDPTLIGYRSVGPADFVPAAEAGVDERCIGFEMDTQGSSDGSIPAGWRPWGLCLVLTTSGWRVRDQGTG